MQNEDILDLHAFSARKRAIRDMADKWAPRREAFIAKSSFLKEDEAYLRFLVPSGLNILDVGCGTGHLLASLNPKRGIGIDMSAGMVEAARTAHPRFDYVLGDAERLETIKSIEGKFDVIILHDTIGSMEDCQSTLTNLRMLCHADTRLIIAYYNYLWEPMLWLAGKLNLRMPVPQTNWLKPADTVNLLSLADFEVVRTDWRQLIPARLLGIGRFINRFVGTLPGIRRLCVRNYIVARPIGLPSEERLAVTVIVPCRNERGNIEPIIQRIPNFGDDLEILFIEGHSKDGTYEEVERLIPIYKHRDIKLLRQDGKGKGDAVYKAFDAARGDVLMILDADISVPPEDLPKFYNALRSGKGEFINGSRLVYPMEHEAMRFLNRIANHTFSLLFSWLLNQRFTDTLCGTKVLRKKHYQRIKENRSYFGNFDPFGDFDLIFGAAKLNLKIQELPIPYAARKYGETQISRFSHGWLLLRMVVFAYFKLKVLS
jgi:SAM-dependent methyltransferase